MCYSEEYWRNRIEEGTPEKVQRAIKRVYQAYPQECLPQGLADPMYIMNVIAKEIGFGDGQSHFDV